MSVSVTMNFNRYIVINYGGPVNSSNGGGSAPYKYAIFYWDGSTWVLEHNSGSTSSTSYGYTLQRNGFSYLVETYHWTGAWTLYWQTAGRADSTPPTVNSVSTNFRLRNGVRDIDYTFSDDHTGVKTVRVDITPPGASSATILQSNPSSYSSGYQRVTYTTPGTYYVSVWAFDQRDVGVYPYSNTWASAVSNESARVDTSFYVDPVPTSGPTASVYTVSSPLALQITRTDGTCDLSRYEIYCGGVLRLYAEDSAASDYCDFSTLDKSLANREVQFRGYQINYTGTSPATILTSHSGSSPYRTHNMLKRKNSTIEKRASWLNGVTP